MPFGLHDVREGMKQLDAIGTRHIGFGKGHGRDKESDDVIPTNTNPPQGQGKHKRKRTTEKEVIPTNKPVLPYLDIANDPYFIKA